MFFRLSEMYSYGSKSLSPQISPTRSSRSSKLEALDNLVISTIYNVSSKLCAASSSALSKAATVIPDPGEEEVKDVVIYLFNQLTVNLLMSRLQELRQSSISWKMLICQLLLPRRHQGNSQVGNAIQLNPNQQEHITGALRNLKKVEQALEALNILMDQNNGDIQWFNQI